MAVLKNIYQVLRAGMTPYESVIFPSAALRGVAVAQNGSVDDNHEATGELASGSNPKFLGHLVRDITVAGGPTLEDQVFGRGLESAGRAGREQSVEVVEEYAAEGSDYIFIGANGLTEDVPVNTPITFTNGKARVAVTGDYAFYLLTGVIEPEDSTSTPPKRFHFRKCVPYLVEADDGTYGL